MSPGLQRAARHGAPPLRLATYIGGHGSSFAELLSGKAPTVVEKIVGNGCKERFRKLTRDGAYASLFSLPSPSSVTYVLEGLTACCAVRSLGHPALRGNGSFRHLICPRNEHTHSLAWRPFFSAAETRLPLY